MNCRSFLGRTMVRPAVMMATIVTAPLSHQLGADDADGAKPAIAKRVNETTRSDGVKVSSKHPLSPAVIAAVSSRDSLDRIKDYTATFTKREQIKGQMLKSVMELKTRREPFSVYLRYTEPHAGREVLYVEGLHKGNLLVHEEGIKSLAGTLALSPAGEQALKENRYPVTDIGMHKMLDILISQWALEARYGEITVKPSTGKVGDVECQVFEATHPQQRAHFKFHKTKLYIAAETNLPVRLEQHGFPSKSGDSAPIVEEYTYSNIKMNVGLTDEDFDRKNKSYKF